MCSKICVQKRVDYSQVMLEMVTTRLLCISIPRVYVLTTWLIQQTNWYFSFLLDNRLWHFMQIVSWMQTVTLHEISKPVFWGKIRKNITKCHILIFMLPDGRAYSRRFVRPSHSPSVHLSVRPLHFCPEHISNSVQGNLMKLDTLVEGHEGNCRMQEP